MKLRHVGAVVALIAAAAGTATVALGAQAGSQAPTSLRGTIALTGSPCIDDACSQPAQIYLFHLATGKLSQLTKGPLGHRALGWSPDGSRLLVQSGPTQLAAPLYSMRADGSSAVLLAQRADPEQASWSPQGRRVAYLAPATSPSLRGSPRSLYVVDANGTHRRLLTKLVGRTAAFSWSPDGKRIVFPAPYGHRYGLYTVTTTGRPVLRLVRRIFAAQPTWSPDGSRIAFFGHVRSRWGVAVIRADGSHLRLLRSGFFPVWSPNGSWIAASTGGPPQSANWVMHPNGTGARTWQGSTSLITFSPNSANLAYVGGRKPNPTGDLWIASTKGSKPTRVLHDGALYFYSPLWRGGTGRP